MAYLEIQKPSRKKEKLKPSQTSPKTGSVRGPSDLDSCRLICVSGEARTRTERMGWIQTAGDVHVISVRSRLVQLEVHCRVDKERQRMYTITKHRRKGLVRTAILFLLSLS